LYQGYKRRTVTRKPEIKRYKKNCIKEFSRHLFQLIVRRPPELEKCTGIVERKRDTYKRYRHTKTFKTVKTTRCLQQDLATAENEMYGVSLSITEHKPMQG